MAAKDEDVESQKAVIINYSFTKLKSPKARWRYLKLIFGVQRRPTLVAIAGRSTNLGEHVSRDSEIPVTATPSSTTEVTLDIFHADNSNNSHHDVIDQYHDLQYNNINKIIKDKDIDSLLEFGGVLGFAEALGSDVEMGIPSNDQHRCCRRVACKTSDLEAPKICLLLHLLRSSNNYIIFLLLLSGVLSIGFGIREEGPSTGWFEGAIILYAVVILLVVPLIRDTMRGMGKRESAVEEREIMRADVVRGGRRESICMIDVLLGEIVCLKRGQPVPADGLFVSGEFLELDDGSKAVVNSANPFLFYGAEVIGGEGRMLVTSAGENTVWAKAMSSATHFRRTVPFASQLDKVNTWKQIVGLVISVAIVVILFLRFEFTKRQANPGIPDVRGKAIKVEEFKDLVKRIVMKPSGKISTLMTSLTMLLVGVVEGLPFCVTLAIAYWNRTGLAFARELSACVAMGSVTAICTDSVGGLALEPLEVDKLWIGEEEITENSVVAWRVREALCEAISTSLLVPQALVTAAEEPILSWAVPRFCLELETVRQCTTVLDISEWIDSEGRGLLIMRNNNGENEIMRLHCRGLATTILPKCSLYYNNEGLLMNMDEEKLEAFQKIVEHMQSIEQLKVIAFAYKQTHVPNFEDNGLELLGLVGLKVRIREDIKESIRACASAGVRIILVSTDKVENLVAIAQEFGILTSPNGNQNEIITGEDFRKLKDDERMEMVSRISVMGNSLTSDKDLLVKLLMKHGDSVAVIGVGTNDVPALKAADVGLVMGSWSTSVARASADIVVRNTNIGFLDAILRYGRCIYSNIQKYIQLELTMLVSGLLITFVTIASTGNMPITAIQSSWVNLVVPMLGGLALLIEQPSENLMKPLSERNKGVITKAMWANIVSQAVYQATVLLTFQFKGQAILGINDKVRKTIVFNSFVLCQVFNQFNSREVVLKNKFKAIHKNHWFWVALCVTVSLQEIFIEMAHFIAGDARLNLAQWLLCFLIGMVSLIIDWAEKFILGFIMD